jgi:hypothetical protein
MPSRKYRTNLQRKIRQRRKGLKRKKTERNKGTTPKFPVHID